MNNATGRILEIDLTNKVTKLTYLEPDIIKKFIGGRSLGGKLLYDQLAPKTDPLGPENKLIILTGPLTGTIVPNAGKYAVITKSPLTGAFLDTYASGYIAPELKFAGWDGLIISGKSDVPVYLWIENDQVEFRGASHIWGKQTIKSEDMIRNETDNSAGILVIGPAGENLVRFASINSDHYRQAGRGGVGAVMGSKNLKGIAVHGTGSVEPYDVEGVMSKYLANLAKLKSSKVGQARKKYGTPMTLTITNKAGMLPVRNFQASAMEEAVDKIDANAVERLTIKTRACWGCMIGCSKITKGTEAPFKDDIVEGPEYETLGMLGANLGVTNLSAIIHSNLQCDELGLDTMSTGVVIGFLMECTEKQIVTRDDIGVEDVAFGNAESVHRLIHMIANREGIGDYLAEGVKRLAEHIGQDSYKFAMHVKGMEFPAYDPRAAFGSCLSYAVSPRGACHRRAWPPAKEVLGNIPPFTTDGKGIMVKDLFNENGILHTLLVCDFPAKFIPIGLEDYAVYLSAVTGAAFSLNDLLDVAERGETIIRMFNNREGFTRADDTLPIRIFDESVPERPDQYFNRDDLTKMLDDYYRARGWDLEGKPLQKTLQRLELC